MWRWREIWECGLDFLYPRDCLECGAAMTTEDTWKYLCARCVERKLYRVFLPACPVCGFPDFGDPESEEERFCEHCLQLNPWFGQGRTLMLLRGAGRRWIHELKYHKGKHLLADLPRLLADRPDLQEYFKDRTLVPVPLHARKERQRGFNQSLWIARELARFGTNCRVETLLRRVKYSGSQTSLGRQARAANLKNTFALCRNHLLSEKKSYLIIDDVFTTGATLNACAQVLVEAGARRVDVFTVGHG